MKFKFAFLFSVLILTAPSAYAGKPPPPMNAEYSADMEMSADGKTQMTGKVYQSGKKQRMEMGGNASITRLDKKVMWQLMPKQKSYMEMAVPDENIPPTEKNNAEMTEMGNETVNGVSAAKYKVVAKIDGEKEESFIWFTKEGIMVKTEGRHEGKTVGMELKNLKIGKQDASLFEIPQGYKNMGNPMDMFASMKKRQKDEGIETYPDAKYEKFAEPAEYSAITRDNLRIQFTEQKIRLQPETDGYDVSAIIQKDKGILTEFLPNMCAYTERKVADGKRWQGKYLDLSRYNMKFLKAVKKTEDGDVIIEGQAEMTDAAGVKYQGPMSVSGDGIVMRITAYNSKKPEHHIVREYSEASLGKPEAARMEVPKGFKKISPEEFEKMVTFIEEEGRSYTTIPGSFCPGGVPPKEAKHDGGKKKGNSGGKKAEKGGNDEEKSDESPDAMKALKKLGGKFGF